MLTLRQSPFDLIRGDLLESDLFKKLEQQLHSAETQKAERVPAAEVHETPEAYTIALELPGVDKGSIDVKATDRTLVISAERRSGVEVGEPAALISEIRYGTWSRSFRFPGGIQREGLAAHYRDGVLTVIASRTPMRSAAKLR